MSVVVDVREDAYRDAAVGRGDAQRARRVGRGAEERGEDVVERARLASAENDEGGRGRRPGQRGERDPDGHGIGSGVRDLEVGHEARAELPGGAGRRRNEKARGRGVRGDEGAVVRRVVDGRRPRGDAARAGGDAHLDPVGGVRREVRQRVDVVDLHEPCRRDGARDQGAQRAGGVAHGDFDRGRLAGDFRDPDVHAEAGGPEAGHEDERRARPRRRGRGFGGDREPERAAARRGRGRAGCGDDAWRGAQEERPVAFHPERVVHGVLEGARRERRQRHGERARVAAAGRGEPQADVVRPEAIRVEEPDVGRVEGSELSDTVRGRRDEGRRAGEIGFGLGDRRFDEERPSHEPARAARHGVRDGEPPRSLERPAREGGQRLERRGREAEDLAHRLARTALRGRGPSPPFRPAR